MVLSGDELKALQQTELELFKAFIEVCEKLNIKYYLEAGTLLGAVRHKGFIPWDDDIDVGIMREDYERFIEKAGELLPEHIFLQTNGTDPEYPHIFAKLRNKNTAFVECSVKNNNMNHGVFIDVFPIDSCDLDVRNSFSFRMKEKIYSMSSSSIMKNYKLNPKRRFIRFFCNIVCGSPRNALRRLEKLYRSMPNGKDCANFSGVYGDREIMPKDWYSEGETLNFEGLSVTVPKEYDKWLTQVYGDYMQFPPEEKRVTLHSTIVIDTKKSYLFYKNN